MVLCQCRQFTCTVICNGRMERNFTAHVECLRYVTSMRSRCQTSSKRKAVIPGIKSNEFVLWCLSFEMLYMY